MVHETVENHIANAEKNSGSTRDLTNSLSSYNSEAIENERIRLFNEKKAAETIPFKYEQKYDSEIDCVLLQYARYRKQLNYKLK